MSSRRGEREGKEDHDGCREGRCARASVAAEGLPQRRSKNHDDPSDGIARFSLTAYHDRPERPREDRGNPQACGVHIGIRPPDVVPPRRNPIERGHPAAVVNHLSADGGHQDRRHIRVNTCSSRSDPARQRPPPRRYTGRPTSHRGPTRSDPTKILASRPEAPRRRLGQPTPQSIRPAVEISQRETRLDAAPAASADRLSRRLPYAPRSSQQRAYPDSLELVKQSYQARSRLIDCHPDLTVGGTNGNRQLASDHSCSDAGSRWRASHAR